MDITIGTGTLTVYEDTTGTFVLSLFNKDECANVNEVKVSDIAGLVHGLSHFVALAVKQLER